MTNSFQSLKNLFLSFNYSDSVQNCLETRVDVVRTSLRQLQEKLSQVSVI